MILKTSYHFYPVGSEYFLAFEAESDEQALDYVPKWRKKYKYNDGHLNRVTYTQTENGIVKESILLETW